MHEEIQLTWVCINVLRKTEYVKSIIQFTSALHVAWKYEFNFEFIEKTTKTNLILLFFPLSIFNNLSFKFCRYWIFAFTNLPVFPVEGRKTFYLMYCLFYCKFERLTLLFLRHLGVCSIQLKSNSDHKWNPSMLARDYEFCFPPFDVQLYSHHYIF